MKTNKILKNLFFTGTIILFAFVFNSCKKDKNIDTKEIAQEENEEKFDNSKQDEKDSRYLVEAAETDSKEIEIGKLAQEKSTDPDVKAFGKMLVDDHTQAAGDVKKLAARKNISLPDSMTEEARKEYDDLNKKSGLDFDKKFAEMMVKGHEKAIDKMTEAAEEAADEEIRYWATNKIPTLTEHLEHAKSLKGKIDNRKK